MLNFDRLRRIFSKRQRVAVPEYPVNILMEPTNSCNLRCRMCSVWGDGVRRKREVGFMSREVWVAALDEIGSWPARVMVDLHGAGEPLLHPSFFDIMAYAKSKGNIGAGLLCNGMLLDADRGKALLETGADWVGFSVDGAQREVYEHYRRGAVLNQVEENIERFLSMRREGRSPSVYLNMVGHEEADVELFIKRWAGKVETLMISKKKPVLREDNIPVRLRKACPLPYQQMVMGWDGHTVLCCEDCWGDYITGKFPEEGLLDIWRGDRFNQAREKHESGRYKAISICRTCDSSLFHRCEERVVGESDAKSHVRTELKEINTDVTGT